MAAADKVKAAEKQVAADAGIVEGKLVQFLQDIAPYCKGDIVRLDAEAVKYVEARIKALGLEGAVHTSKVQVPAEHTNSTAGPVVGSVQAATSTPVDQPTTVVGGTVINEQDAATEAQKPSDKEVAARTEDPANPRG